MSIKATTAIFIDKYHPKVNNECAISIKITFERKRKYYPTPYTLSEKEFEKIMYAKRLSEAEKQQKKRIAEFENKAIDIIKDLQVFSWKTFEKKYLLNRGAKESINYAFTEYANGLREAGRIGTAVSYECAQKSIDKFCADVKFSDVTPEFLRDYEKWMLNNKNSITTVGIYLRSLRTIFNNAIDEGSITKEYYPFGKKKYEIPTGNNIKKALTLNDIALLYNYQPEKGTSEAMAKDFWLFMYLCNGINMKDVCLLKYKNIKGDKIFFERAKTARTKRKVEPIEIIIIPDVERIISILGNKDKNPDNYIFPILQKGITPERERQLIQQIIQVVNSHMKNIASKLGITSKTTTYAARHSFATILQRNGVSTSFISEALGHSNVITTQNYLAGFEDESKREINKALLAFKK
jgi:integrase/recombinase XerD